MLKHQCTLLCVELETTRHDLRKAHQNIAKLIVMHRDSSREIAALKGANESLRIEQERLRWTLSGMYSRERGQGKVSLGYAYGDYSKK